jgi:nicotinate-nucleotide adenylyltransferase
MTSENTKAGKERWGVLGGTFDPPHLGHFQLAQAAADQLTLTKVLWVPSFSPPHKKKTPLTPFVTRALMTEMTARRDRRFDVSRIESSLEGDSFTVKTLAKLAKALPEIQLYFIVGADVLPELADWFKPERIARWAVLACGVRDGYERPEQKDLPVADVVYFDSPKVGISSSGIRTKIASGVSISGLVSPDTEALIEKDGLYR